MFTTSQFRCNQSHDFWRMTYLFSQSGFRHFSFCFFRMRTSSFLCSQRHLQTGLFIWPFSSFSSRHFSTCFGRSRNSHMGRWCGFWSTARHWTAVASVGDVVERFAKFFVKSNIALLENFQVIFRRCNLEQLNLKHIFSVFFDDVSDYFSRANITSTEHAFVTSYVSDASQSVQTPIDIPIGRSHVSAPP